MNAPTLSKDDPALLALEAEYARLNLFPLSAWKTWVNSIDVQNFRGEPGFLAQLWMMNEERYQNSFDYLCSLNLRRAMELHGEDDAFGCVTFQRDGVTFSRDLIDSTLELDFLVRTLGLQTNNSVELLDIGAGYGRFLHRFTQAFSAGSAIGVDGVPLSTYLCRFYLAHRGLSSRAAACLPSEIPSGAYFDIATNQQSFSEMPLAAVDFWLSRCNDMNIRYFFLEPHAGDLIHPHYVTTEVDGSHLNYWHLFEHYGYREIRREYKFPEERSAEFIYNTQFIMLERKS